jgi:Transposase, Mutator family/Tn3 transposase DDE domain
LEQRDLSAKRYVYFWVDGIHVQARLEEAAQCLLVIIGATPEGKKELVGLIDGVRESAQSWKELLLDLQRRGLAMGPELAIARRRLLAGGRGGVAEDARPAQLGAQDRQCLEHAAFLGRSSFHRFDGILDRTYENQQHRAFGLNLVVTAIILWNAEYLDRVIAALSEIEDVPTRRAFLDQTPYR